jgi:hypothetical protein
MHTRIQNYTGAFTEKSTPRKQKILKLQQHALWKKGLSIGFDQFQHFWVLKCFQDILVLKDVEFPKKKKLSEAS